VAELVLDKLRVLQQADLELRRLEQKKSAHDRAAKVRSEQIVKQKDAIEALRLRHRQARMAADKKELEVKQKRADIEKLRGQQTQVKDNRQFSALQNEIKFAELAITKFEDEILADMGDLDSADVETKRAEEDLKRLEAELEAVRKEIAAKKSEVDAEIAACRQRRDEIAKTLPAKAVDMFTRIADRLSGEALAAVVRDEEDDDGAFICSGCHMSVTQNTYVLLASRNESLCTCPNCTRILFLDKP
jgi:uncharacterized protein